MCVGYESEQDLEEDLHLADRSLWLVGLVVSVVLVLGMIRGCAGYTVCRELGGPAWYCLGK